MLVSLRRVRWTPLPAYPREELAYPWQAGADDSSITLAHAPENRVVEIPFASPVSAGVAVNDVRDLKAYMWHFATR